jgi:hypothetical protein
LQQIGIDVGDNSDDKISCVQNLLACELEREDVEFDGLEQVGFDSDSDDDNFEMFELKALKSLCGEMMEEVFDDNFEMFELKALKSLCGEMMEEVFDESSLITKEKASHTLSRA